MFKRKSSLKGSSWKRRLGSRTPSFGLDSLEGLGLVRPNCRESSNCAWLIPILRVGLWCGCHLSGLSGHVLELGLLVLALDSPQGLMFGCGQLSRVSSLILGPDSIFLRVLRRGTSIRILRRLHRIWLGCSKICWSLPDGLFSRFIILGVIPRDFFLISTRPNTICNCMISFAKELFGFPCIHVEGSAKLHPNVL